jgi:hypothetical protein
VITNEHQLGNLRCLLQDLVGRYDACTYTLKKYGTTLLCAKYKSLTAQERLRLREALQSSPQCIDVLILPTSECEREPTRVLLVEMLVSRQPMVMRHETRVSVPINAAVFTQSSTLRTRHGCKRPMEVLRPGSCLMKAQAEREPYIQLRVMRKLEEANVRRAAPDLFFRGEKSVGIEVVYFV